MYGVPVILKFKPKNSAKNQGFHAKQSCFRSHLISRVLLTDFFYGSSTKKHLSCVFFQIILLVLINFVSFALPFSDINGTKTKDSKKESGIMPKESFSEWS
jgi:hypothetical protein